jgi:hypothetical protein
MAGREPSENGPVSDYALMQGETRLGTLSVSLADQPFLRCTLQPTDAFEAVRWLFEERLRRAEDAATEWSDLEEIEDQIDALNLRLMPRHGEPITDFLLHVRGDEAWFRY